MSVLLVDVGNSRVKWAHWSGARMGKQHAETNTGWSAEDYRRKLLPGAGLSGRGRRGRTEQRLERIIVSNVAGPQIQRLLRTACRQARAPMPEFVTSRRSAAGITTDYLEPWRLGVDRFVAAVGAHHLVGGQPVVVVNVGTAVTLDLVDPGGRHRGGAIIPGPQLMVESLLRHTNGIRRRAGGGRSGARSLFARSTRTALVQGALHATAAIIDRSVEEAQRLLGRRPLVLLTGGGAPQVRPLLHNSSVSTPNLVLHGLAVWASLHH